ncbi:MAG: M3 family metallopeptidase, partial [Myxococcota bacterium]
MKSSLPFLLLGIASAACAAQPAPPASTPASSVEAAAVQPPSPPPETPPPEPVRDTAYVWDLSDLYPTTDAWNEARQHVLTRIGRLARHQGTLRRSPKVLKAFAQETYDIAKDVSRVFSYASLSRDEDQRLPDAQSRFELARAMGSEYQKATAWVQPELLAMGAPRIERFIKADPSLAPYVFFLRDTVRQAAHTLDEEGEQLLASAGLVLSSPSQIYQMLVNADIDWPTLTLADGTQVKLSQAGYTKYRAVPHRPDRERVFDTFWGVWSQYLDSIGAMMTANVQSQVFRARARKYGSAVEAALDNSKIPLAVYDTLLAETNAALPTLHRYFRLRARMLKVDDLGYFDIYPPLVQLDSQGQYDIEKSKVITLEALAPFGKDYV